MRRRDATSRPARAPRRHQRRRSGGIAHEARGPRARRRMREAAERVAHCGSTIGVFGSRVEDVAFLREGLRLTLRRSKTDQEGRGIAPSSSAAPPASASHRRTSGGTPSALASSRARQGRARASMPSCARAVTAPNASPAATSSAPRRSTTTPPRGCSEPEPGGALDRDWCFGPSRAHHAPHARRRIIALSQAVAKIFRCPHGGCTERPHPRDDSRRPLLRRLRRRNRIQRDR